MEMFADFRFQTVTQRVSIPINEETRSRPSLSKKPVTRTGSAHRGQADVHHSHNRQQLAADISRTGHGVRLLIRHSTSHSTQQRPLIHHEWHVGRISADAGYRRQRVAVVRLHLHLYRHG